MIFIREEGKRLQDATLVYQHSGDGFCQQNAYFIFSTSENVNIFIKTLSFFPNILIDYKKVQNEMNIPYFKNISIIFKKDLQIFYNME